jgi:hypothetical protein
VNKPRPDLAESLTDAVVVVSVGADEHERPDEMHQGHGRLIWYGKRSQKEQKKGDVGPKITSLREQGF